MKSKQIVLLSGGMDSVTALYYTHETCDVVGAISFDYGSKHNHKEIPFAEYHAVNLGVRHEVVKLDFIERCFKSSLLLNGNPIPDGHYEEESMKSTVVPFRNGIMLSISAGFAESQNADGIVIAAHAGDHAIYPDCREVFMRSMGEAITQGTYSNIKLLRPFIHYTKAEIVKIGRSLGVRYRDTWSCYKGGDTHCGTCGTCVERREAFMVSGIPDPTVYLSNDPLPAGKVRTPDGQVCDIGSPKYQDYIP